ncbi:MAG: hypothetical protein JWO38_7286 [Gemmataceae bacterium]|nr:hypothetical protein [Gemmataceae bacterium]
MTRSHKVLGFLLVSLLGIYGCARGPVPGSGGDRAALEAKVQRLEEDFRAAAAARDSFRQKLLAVEEKQGQTQRQLEQANATAAHERQERETAKAELKTRTAERDNLQTHFDAFRKNIKELIGQAETALNTSAPPPALVGTLPVPTAPAPVLVGTLPVPTAPAPVLVEAQTGPNTVTNIRN